jgi:two-component system sensor kinase FixL
MKSLLSIYAPANRTKLLFFSGFLIVAIALADYLTRPYISLGFLYLFPIMVAGGFLTPIQTIGTSLLCSILQEAFSNLPSHDAIARLVLSSAGFVGTGLFISELVGNRRSSLAHVIELEEEMERRRDAEGQLRILVESSPASIVTIDLSGTILLANEAARQLLGARTHILEGRSINSFLPALQTVLEAESPRAFRTALQCRGQREDGEAFLAGIWFSTYVTMSGPRLAAIVVDLSEDLRNREDLSLDHLLKSSRILMGAVAHEVRNLCSAILVVHENLSRSGALADSEDFKAMSTLVRSLEKVAALQLRPLPTRSASAVDLTSVIDELRVLVDSAYHDSEMEVRWDIPDALPLVWADRYGLVQVVLNLAKNSRRAMDQAQTKRLTVTATRSVGSVVIRFADTGNGVASPEGLFRAFQNSADSTGLGLYVSRAIMRSFGGDLLYEPSTRGCCFVVVLPVIGAGEATQSA